MLIILKILPLRTFYDSNLKNLTPKFWLCCFNYSFFTNIWYLEILENLLLISCKVHILSVGYYWCFDFEHIASLRNTQNIPNPSPGGRCFLSPNNRHRYYLADLVPGIAFNLYSGPTCCCCVPQVQVRLPPLSLWFRMIFYGSSCSTWWYRAGTGRVIFRRGLRVYDKIDPRSLCKVICCGLGGTLREVWVVVARE